MPRNTRTRAGRPSPGATPTRPSAEDGVAAVEFAIVGTVFLMLTFGILTFGLVFALNHTLSHAAAEGARSGLTPAAGATVKDTAENAARSRLGWLGAGASVVAAVEPCASDTARQCVRVVTSYNWADNPLVPPLPGLGLVMPDVMSRFAVVQISQV